MSDSNQANAASVPPKGALDLMRDRTEVTPQLENNFKYHSPQPGQPEKYSAIREACKETAYLMTKLCPASRELSVALTQLETANFWANAAIARNSAAPSSPS